MVIGTSFVLVRQLQDGSWSPESIALIRRSLTLSASTPPPLHPPPPKRAEWPEIELLANGQRFSQPCLCDETSIKNP